MTGLYEPRKYGTVRRTSLWEKCRVRGLFEKWAVL